MADTIKIAARPLLMVVGIAVSVVMLAACAPWYEGYDITSDQELTRLSAVPELRKALKDEAPDVRANAAIALKGIGPDALDAVPDLMEALNDSYYEVRQAAADALEAMLPALSEAEAQAVEVQINITRLESENWMVRRNAANKLAEMGRDASKAVPALILAMLDDSDWRSHYASVRIAAARALGAIGFPARAANPALIEMSKSDNYRVRLAAVEALGKIGPRSASNVIAALKDALDDPDFDVRREAASALGGFGVDAESTVDQLVKALSGPDFDVRRQAATSLGRIGPRSDEAIQALVNTLDDRDADVRTAAVKALGMVVPEKRKVVLPAVISALNDNNESVRLGAVSAVASIGIASPDVMDALERAVHEDKSVEVKSAAAETFLRFREEQAAQVKDSTGSTPPAPVSQPVEAEKAVLQEASAVTPGTPVPDVVTATVPILNVRASGSLESKVVGKLRGGDRAEVLEAGPEWVKIKKTDGTVGFVYEQYIEEYTREESASKRKIVSKTTSSKLVTATVPVLNIRATPSLEARVIGKLHDEDSAKVLETMPEWVKIKKTDDTVGFVYKSYTARVSP
ncbi:MAG: HEAT repeat domain-containing protein [Thermodesulfobacteriota bacterium]|nr:HEAT repeat domain-containing protein [Thermodesulfobacteriota bacterium]